VAGELNEDSPAVLGRWSPRHQLFQHKAVDQSNGAVVAEPQPLGQLAHGDSIASGKTFDRQERLMLLGCDAGAMCGLFAEMKELPQGVTKLGQYLILRFRKLVVLRHRRGFYSRSRPNVSLSASEQFKVPVLVAAWRGYTRYALTLHFTSIPLA
jgi:hypothetical protein